ncbi:hypothetical protein D3C75_814230 [compost metagenome]
MLQKRDVHLPPDQQGEHKEQRKLQGRDECRRDDLLSHAVAAGHIKQGCLLVDLQSQLMQQGEQRVELLA